MKLAASAATLLLAVALLAQPANAEGDAASGKELAYTCLGCHGIEGYRNAYPSYRVPKLGGQKAGYIEIALRGYRDGTRDHPTMVAQGQSLSDQDIADLAARHPAKAPKRAYLTNRYANDALPITESSHRNARRNRKAQW